MSEATTPVIPTPAVRTVEQKLADAGAEMLKRMVGHTALSARQRLRQVEAQFGRDAVVAAIGSEAALTQATTTLESLIAACGVNIAPGGAPGGGVNR